MRMCVHACMFIAIYTTYLFGTHVFYMILLCYATCNQIRGHCASGMQHSTEMAVVLEEHAASEDVSQQRLRDHPYRADLGEMLAMVTTERDLRHAIGDVVLPPRGARREM